MAGVLYDFQKQGNNKREENKNNFIRDYYDELGFSKKYISPSEKEEIFKNHKINKDDLNDIVYEANEKFIESRKIFILKDFNDVLESNEFFDETFCNELKNKYHQGGYDFYDEIDCDKRINDKNNNFKSKTITNFKKNLDSYEYIDNYALNELKLKYNNFEYNLIEKSIFINYIDEKNALCKESKMSDIFNNFKEDLDSYEYIDDSICDELKSKYNNFNYKYANPSEFLELIEKRNQYSIHSQSDEFSNDLNSFLSSCGNVIDNNTRLNLKLKYKKDYYNFYDKLNFDKKIDEHNKKIIPKIIQKVLSNEDGYISDSRLYEIKSQYSSEIINWNSIIGKYNVAYENKRACLSGLFSYYPHDFRFNKSRIANNTSEKMGFDKYKLHNSVNYLFTYVSKKKRYGYNYNEIKLSLGAWKFKDGYEYAIDFFTKELLDAVIKISNEVVKDNIESIALISVPPSKVYNNTDATMRKSIYRITDYYNKNPNMFKNEILDYGNLLYRFQNVPTSHKERQATYDEHIESIVCTKKDLSNDNMAFVIMDDVTTRGYIMNACKNILIKHGAKGKNIYKLAIFATGEWR